MYSAFCWQYLVVKGAEFHDREKMKQKETEDPITSGIPEISRHPVHDFLPGGIVTSGL